jgi:hypothetical protein
MSGPASSWYNPPPPNVRKRVGRSGSKSNLSEGVGFGLMFVRLFTLASLPLNDCTSNLCLGTVYFSFFPPSGSFILVAETP